MCLRYTEGYLVAGKSLDLGAQRLAVLGHARPVPIWIAAGGPKTLRMAGRVADGVIFRVGRHRANLRTAVGAIHSGAREAGRDPSNVKLGAVLHVVIEEDAERAGLIARSMAAGFYEYSPALFDPPGFEWDGPPVEELKKQVWPDFHHHPDPAESGRVVAFLDDAVADAFCAHGDVSTVATHIREMITGDVELDIVVPHPVPTPGPPNLRNSDDPRPDYMERFMTEVMPHIGPR